ncbi:MAG: NAD(P)H-hydrate dehydratase [Bacteroidetes bacterium]|nr:NAD(P)H-hydrate dehydratase [Bacteroidota bacterium]
MTLLTAQEHAESRPDIRKRLLRPVLSAAAMRAADGHTIAELGMPGFTLMEAAGREAARIAATLVPVGSRVLVCCGKGNNGGDGVVLARWMAEAGYAVDVLLAAAPDQLSTDTAAHLDLLQRWPGSGVHLQTDVRAPYALPAADLIVDALFGTGLTSAIRAPFDALIAAINAHPAPVLALDVPSGLSSDSGRALGACVQAVATVTMGALKSGLLLGDGPEQAGTVHVADIGIPATVLFERTDDPGSACLSTDAWVQAHLRPRTRQDHKYTTGPTIVLGGSEDYPGAPILAARAAARVGSGYVVAGAPSSIRAILREKLDAIPVVSWETGHSNLAEGLIQALDTRWTKARAILLGPGLGRTPEVRTLIWDLLDRTQAPVVLDADALFAVAGDRERIAAASGGRWILTPHDGEAARLEAGDTMDPSAHADPSVHADPSTHAHSGNRIERARALARAWNCVILWKGQPSLTASPDGRVIINASGHPAAATAGSGDVLAGIVTGLLAQGLEPAVAAAAGIHISGTAAARFVERGPAQSMVAPDLIEMLPSVLGSFS